MKNNLINVMNVLRHAKTAFIAMVMVCVVLSTGCGDKDKDSDPEPGDNEFVYAGEKSKVVDAYQVYRAYDEGNVVFLYFHLENEHILSFGMLMPSGATKLTAGSYSYPDDGDVIAYAEIWDGSDKELPTLYEATSVDLDVTLSGSKYTIDVDGKLTGKKSLKGNYSGTIKWSEYAGTKSFSLETSKMPDKMQIRMENIINHFK